MQTYFSSVALLAVILLAVSCVAAQEFCPADDEDLVYPYWSPCGAAAVFGERYHIVSANVSEGGLVGNWDESNSTLTYSYVRLTGSVDDLGDTVTLLSPDPQRYGTAVRQNDTVIVATRALRPFSRFWGWRSEGGAETEWFLAEQRCLDCVAANLAFVYAANVTVLGRPCPRLLGVRCQAYYLTSAPGTFTSGLARYVANGETYITLGDEGSVGDLPIVLVRASGTANAIKGRTVA